MGRERTLALSTEETHAGRRELGMRDESCSIYSGNTIINIPNTCLKSKLMTPCMFSNRVSHLSLKSSSAQQGKWGLKRKHWEKRLPHADAQKRHSNICLHGGLYQRADFWSPDTHCLHLAHH